MKVLVLDDDLLLLRSTVRHLKHTFEVHKAEGPLDKAGDYMGFDAVVTDFEMPNGGGERVVRDCKVAKVPVVVFTGNPVAAVDIPDDVPIVTKGKGGEHEELIAVIKELGQ